MTVVEEYWHGVLERLQAEVDVFATLVRHHGEQGKENEAALIRLLDGFVPRRLGTGTGLLIDAEDHYSRQTDVVLFDVSTEPRVLAQTTQLLFPIETVHGCIEVKTSLRTRDLEDFATKKASLLSLKPARPHPDGSNFPLFAFVAYSSQISPETLAINLRDLDPEHQPDLMCVVDLGVVAGNANVLFGNGDAESRGDFVVGLTLLRDEAGDPVVPPDPRERYHSMNQRQYPIVALDGGNFVGEPARGLLVFVEALARRLAIQQKLPVPAFSLYLKAETRSLRTL